MLERLLGAGGTALGVSEGPKHGSNSGERAARRLDRRYNLLHSKQEKWIAPYNSRPTQLSLYIKESHLFHLLQRSFCSLFLIKAYTDGHNHSTVKCRCLREVDRKGCPCGELGSQ